LGGVVAVELAVLAPLLMLAFVCITDLGLGIYANMQVDSAAQYGVQYAVTNGYDASAIRSAVKSTSDIDLNVAPTSFCGCPGTSGVAQSLCNLQCSDGSTPGTFVTVTVAHDYVTLLPYPGIPPRFALSSQSTVRLK
jgi:Flp pilus assembly protein TadG